MNNEQSEAYLRLVEENRKLRGWLRVICEAELQTEEARKAVRLAEIFFDNEERS